MLSIVIVNYKNEDRTISYVKEELIKITIPHIVVVVNNSSTVESDGRLKNELGAELVKDINIFPCLDKKYYVISHPENLGFAKGNNLGVEFCTKHFDITYLLFSNNDIRFIDDHVTENLIKKAESLRNIALIGPKIIGLDGRNQSPEPYVSFWNRYIWLYWLAPFISINKKKRLFKLDYSEKATEGIHYKLMGSFFLVKAIDFLKCGMMDPNTFLYAEEMILSDRLKTIGKYAYYYPKVTVIHEHSQTISQYLNAEKSLKTRFTSESFYYRKYRGVSPVSIVLGKLSLKCYIFLKRTIHKKQNS